MITKIETAQTLLDALPYIKQYRNEIFVIKYGGSAQINPELKDKFAQDIILLYLIGIKPIVVHGGGKKINEMLDKLQIESEFVDGMRVTNAQVMEVVEMVLSGNINKEITTLLNMHGGKAMGMTGKDANFLTAEPKANGKYGLVGEIVNIDSEVIKKLIEDKFIPVIAPIASANEINHPGFNINADLAASKIAAAVNAKKIIFMTDIVGVLDKDKNLLTTLTEEEIYALKADGTIHGGMIPKVDACLEAIDGGVEKAHIIDGRVEHSILLEVLTSEGIGTVIKKY
ncbi:acetylglutamate kinase [Sulfurimonas sp.]|uniref:acetylglutamate kinase n=1 Tax=Sulfurimonas sp. TaxID=2022749 RepID=UPI0026068502|nr:acetylglutamate kinase [Sulfurimonas sp.]